MSNKVLLKRSSVQGKVPSASSLEYGELALNYEDGILYYKDTSNTVKSFLSELSINDLSDVDTNTTSPNTGDVLKWNGTNWVPGTDSTSGGAGTDADTLDGFDSTYFLNYTNLSNTPAIPSLTSDLVNDSGFLLLTDLSVTTAAPGTASLSYNNINGVFTYTPPDLSSYLTSETTTSIALNGNSLDYTDELGNVTNISLAAYLDDTTNTVLSAALNGNTVTFTREDGTTFTLDVTNLYDDTNLVTSVNGNTGNITVQPTLVSGTNIKTINGTSLLGSGDITISGTGGTSLTVSEIDGSNNTSNEVTNVSAIRFDNTTGFNVTDLGSGEVKVALGSSFKTLKVSGQSDLVASGEDTLELVAGTGISITTNTSSTPKALTITAIGTSSISDLTDVTITSVAPGDVLQYDSGTGDWVNAPAGSVSTPLGGLSDVTITDPTPSQVTYYDGIEWKNEYKYNIVPNVPFTKEDGTEQFLDLINIRDLTTVLGFLNNIVTQSYYLPFTKADGSYVTTLVLG